MILSVSLNPKITKRIVVDDLVKGSDYMTDRIYLTPEGGGMDISKVISEFNEEVYCIGLLGGNNGEKILEFLNANKINSNFILTKNEARAKLSILTEDGEATSFTEISPRIYRQEIEEFYSLYRTSMEFVDIVCISDEILRGVRENIQADLVLMANENSKKVLTAISGEALKKVLLEEPYLLNITLEDLENITNLRIETDSDIIKLGGRLIEGTTEVIAIYKGNGNYIILYNRLAYVVNLMDEYLLSEDGGRESFLAGYAVSERRNYDFEYKIRVSIACHIANGLEFESGLVDMARMKSIMNELNITILNI